MTNNQKFELCILDYCKDCMTRSYELTDQGEIDSGLYYLDHSINILNVLQDCRLGSGPVHISEFVETLSKLLDEDARSDVWVFLDERGLAQYIPE